MHNFWDYHGILFILAMFFFPRLTMLFATTVGGGFFLLAWLVGCPSPYCCHYRYQPILRTQRRVVDFYMDMGVGRRIWRKNRN